MRYLQYIKVKGELTKNLDYLSWEPPCWAILCNQDVPTGGHDKDSLRFLQNDRENTNYHHITPNCVPFSILICCTTCVEYISDGCEAGWYDRIIYTIGPMYNIHQFSCTTVKNILFFGHSLKNCQHHFVEH